MSRSVKVQNFRKDDMLPISESIVRQHASPKSYLRGAEYYRSRSVIDLQRRGNSIYAQVEGREISPYRVNIDFALGEIETSIFTQRRWTECDRYFGGNYTGNC